MEGVTGMRGFWKKGNNKYQRLRTGRRRMPTVQLGEGGSAVAPPIRRRRFFVKLGPKVKLSRMMMRCSPKRLLVGLRDAYVNFMNRMAGSSFINSGMAGGGYGGGYGSALGGFSGFGPGPVKEYDEKMIIQIYKSIVLAKSQLEPQATAPPRIAPPPPLATIAECT